MAVRWKRVFLLTVVVLMAVIIFAPPVFAAPDSGQVSTAIESTWKTAAGQIKTVTNNVIFPVVDCVLAILLFVKLAMAYFDYKNMVNLISHQWQSCSLVWCLPLQHRLISGIFLEFKSGKIH